MSHVSITVCDFCKRGEPNIGLVAKNRDDSVHICEECARTIVGMFDSEHIKDDATQKPAPDKPEPVEAEVIE